MKCALVICGDSRNENNTIPSFFHSTEIDVEQFFYVPLEINFCFRIFYWTLIFV